MNEIILLDYAGVALFAAVGVTPYVRAWAISGNPFFPYQIGVPFDQAYVGRANVYRQTNRVDLALAELVDAGLVQLNADQSRPGTTRRSLVRRLMMARVCGLAGE